MPLFFWVLLGMIASAASAVGGAAVAAGGAIAAGAGAIGEAVGIGGGGGGAAGGAAAGGGAEALAGFTDVAIGTETATTSSVVPPTANPAPLSQRDAALTQAQQEDFTTATPESSPLTQMFGSPTPTPVDAPTSLETPPPPSVQITGSGVPVGRTTPTPTISTISPETLAGTPKTLPPLGTLSPTTPEPPSFISRTTDLIRSFKETELGELLGEIQELAGKGSTRGQQPVPVDASPEQVVAASQGTQIPELSRATTVSSPIGLNLDQADKDAPLSFDQLKGLQKQGVLELIAELRTQKRLFG